MHKSALGRVINQVQRRVRTAFLREYKAQVVDSLHASSTGKGATANVNPVCGSGPEHQMLENGTETRVVVEGSGEHDTPDNIPRQPKKKLDDKVRPNPGDETMAATKEAREILARLQEAAEM